MKLSFRDRKLSSGKAIIEQWRRSNPVNLKIFILKKMIS